MIWPILKEKAREQGLPLTTVTAEVLHLVALDVIFGVPESQPICFQGGTSIHLLYGGYRYSEDLDFAGNLLDQELAQKLIKKSQPEIEKNIIQLLGNGQCQWRFPSASKLRRIYAYWLNFQPDGIHQKYRLKLEFASYPVYNTKVMPVRSEFDMLQRRSLVTGLDSSELLAEKISAVASRLYLKKRDLFDLWYLSEVLGTSIDMGLVEKKFHDYRVSWSKRELEEKLASISSQHLSAEMNRFLPQRYREQLSKGDYEIVRRTALGVMQRINEGLSSSSKQK